LTLCDGTRTAAGLRATLAIRYGLFLTTERIVEFLDSLDEALLLENQRSRSARAVAQVEFRKAAFRPPSSAGQAYPSESKELAETLDQYFEPPGESIEDNICGLVSPHIDYERGGPVYAKVWGTAAHAAQNADLAIIFGTDHFSEGQSFSLTRQNYATPFGVLPTDTAIVDELARAIGEETAFAGELHHRREHSIELAAVWLHHIREGKPIPIVPILTGSLETASDHGNGNSIESVLRVLGKAIRKRKTLVIAAGDLAHVGPAFEGEPVNPGKLIQLKSADDELIAAMCRADAEGFYNAIRRVQDANNVCGVAPIYLTLRLLSPKRGERRGYAVCPADEKKTSVVTICGITFHNS
ncbi:MAG: AmmeMemoRadiSam system protein B, partial [Anaerolineaceae bacterium]|nr:AmmeMemoRadiSam system protein B [Anaerolineaceae bacterium]